MSAPNQGLPQGSPAQPGAVPIQGQRTEIVLQVAGQETDRQARLMAAQDLVGRSAGRHLNGRQLQAGGGGGRP